MPSPNVAHWEERHGEVGVADLLEQHEVLLNGGVVVGVGDADSLGLMRSCRRYR